MTQKRLLCCLAFCLLLWPWPSSAQNVKYDLSFKRWGQFYAPWEDWHWWKAQGMAESGLHQQARSYCGAIGVMQLMPATAASLKVNPYDAEENIQGGIKYDASLLQLWKAAAGDTERRNLAFASYNAGPGNIEHAVRLAHGPPAWSSAGPLLVKVTGQHSAETLGYVVRINEFYLQVRWN